jgi:hypothetical protein
VIGLKSLVVFTVAAKGPQLRLPEVLIHFRREWLIGGIFGRDRKDITAGGAQFVVDERERL